MRNSNKNNDNSNASTANGIAVKDALTFLLVGTGVGAALALLFAPKSGREMRHDIADASRRGLDLTKEKANSLKLNSEEKLHTLRDKAGSAYTYAASKLGYGTEDDQETPSLGTSADKENPFEGRKVDGVF